MTNLDKEHREMVELDLMAPAEVFTPKGAGERKAVGPTPQQIDDENAAIAAIMGLKSQIESR